MGMFIAVSTHFPLRYTLQSRPGLKVITGKTSNCKNWEKHFFFVRLDSSSVESESIADFRCDMRPLVAGPSYSSPSDLKAVRNILRCGPFQWGYFSPLRVRLAVEYHRSRTSAHATDYPEFDAADPTARETTSARESRRSRRSSGGFGNGSGGQRRSSRIAGLSESGSIGGLGRSGAAGTPDANEGTAESERGQVPIFPNDGGAGTSRNPLPSFGGVFDTFPDFDASCFDAGTEGGYVGSELYGKSLDRGAGALRKLDRLWNSKVLETEACKLKEQEIAERNARREAEIADAALRDEEWTRRGASWLRRAFRSGKREIAETFEKRSQEYAAALAEHQRAYKLYGEYRECRSSIGAFLSTEQVSYSYDAEVQKALARRERRAFAETLLPSTVSAIQGGWDPITVSQDSEEVSRASWCGGDEVDQPPNFNQ